MSVNSISIKTYNSWAAKPYYDKTRLKEGYIWFNGYKIKTGNSLKETARNINKLYITPGIKAHIIQDKKGYEKLILKVSGNILNINDPQGLLAELYQKGKIGKNKDSIIQVIRRLGGKEEVQINYNLKKIEKKHDFSGLKRVFLSMDNIIYLSNNLVVNRLGVENYSDDSSDDSVEMASVNISELDSQDEDDYLEIRRISSDSDDG